MTALDTLNQETLVRHNELRALHNVPKLQLDSSLTKSAQSYAEKLAKSNKFAHSDNKGEYGENLAAASNSRPGFLFSGETATQSWYDEIKDYKFNQEKQDNGKIGHFSQVVWKNTKYAGFGRAQCSGGKFIIVGQYKPPGNYIGKFKENVTSPSGPAPPLSHVFSSSSRPSGEVRKTPSETEPGTEPIGCCGLLKASGSKKPEIGPRSSGDKFVKTSSRTSTKNGEKTVEVTEMYETPEGHKYERTRKTISKE